MERKPIARWRKTPRETGLRAIGAGPRGYELRIGDETLIRVWPDGGGWCKPLAGWYWTGLGKSGLDSGRFDTAEEAKANATECYKASKP